MARQYVRMRRRSADIDANIDAENYLAKTVYEDFELVDTGVLDEDGNKIMAHEKMDQIGFIRRK
jgi:hypothetical protein